MISNRDIGFVQSGQDAAIKVDTFNFTRYGLLHGKVLTSRRTPSPATSRKRQVERQAAGPDGEQQRAEGPGADLRRPRFARPHADAGRRQAVNLCPGMAVTVEIKTGSRRIISYLLSPLARYRQETLRER